jgi:Zn-dependent peptidase ImmA (M78 family)
MKLTKAARKARALLAKHGVTKAPVDVHGLARQEGIRLEFGDFGADVSGLFVREGDQVILGVNGRDAPTRQRFTIAHELGHYVLHGDNRELFVDKGHYVVYRRNGVSETGLDPMEIEANQFAAELLMPADLVAAAFSGAPLRVDDDQALRGLAARFNVSPMAMAIRLASLDLVVAG